MPAAPLVDRIDDPRVTDRWCRRGPATNVTLLGVVHDHPASVARARIVAEAMGPDVLALELPAAAVPLYRHYASTHGGEGSPTGGEMTAAIGAAPAAKVVGIDAPNWAYVRRLVTRLVADRVAPATARRLLSSLGGATRTALACRIAATVSHATAESVTAAESIEYACSHEASPAAQAAHERRHLERVRALLALGGGQETVTAYRDETREACMRDRLEALSDSTADSTDDPPHVLAIVGIDHLEALEGGCYAARDE